MPLLARMLASPLSIDVRRGAIADLGLLLADRRIANEGRIAVAVGPGQGARIVADLNLPHCEVFQVDEGTVDVANELGKKLRTEAFEAVAGIGGGKTIDVTKFAATMAGIPMIAVATNLSHDGIASPVSSLEHESGKSSYGVNMPVAVVVDVDYVRSAPDRLVRWGSGTCSATCPRSPTGSWPARRWTNRSTGWPSPSPGWPPSPCCTAATP